MGRGDGGCRNLHRIPYTRRHSLLCTPQTDMPQLLKEPAGCCRGTRWPRMPSTSHRETSCLGKFRFPAWFGRLGYFEAADYNAGPLNILMATCAAYQWRHLQSTANIKTVSLTNPECRSRRLCFLELVKRISGPLPRKGVIVCIR